MLNGGQWYGQLLFALFSLKKKRGPKSQKGDPNPQKGTHCVTVWTAFAILAMFHCLPAQALFATYLRF